MNESDSAFEPGSESPQRGDAEQSYAGSVPPLDTPEQRRRAVEIAFDFRGDVTIETRQGQKIEGYVYDRKERDGELSLRIMPSDGSPRLTLQADQIARLVCDRRDPAAGRSFETWVRKYVEQKLRGEGANFEPQQTHDPQEGGDPSLSDDES